MWRIKWEEIVTKTSNFLLVENYEASGKKNRIFGLEFVSGRRSFRLRIRSITV
jgi:hypothetical protein